MVKITGVHVLSRDLPNALVEVHTDEGVTGIGITQSPACDIAPITEDGTGSLSSMLIGEDPQDVRRIWRKMFRGWSAQRGRGAEGGLVVNAMAAIDMALWDLTGKIQGRPIHKLLGGPVQSQLMAYASASAFRSSSYEGEGPLIHKSAEELAQESAIYVEQGFKALKYGWGNYFGPEDEEKLAAIREAIGPNIRLMIDFGCPAYWTVGWNAKAAIRAARMLERYDVYFFEEPMPPVDVEGHAKVTQAVDVNVASGESLCTVYDFLPFIDHRAVDVVQPDAAQMGITQLYDVARRAEDVGILCIPHSPWSAMVVAAHLNVLATLGNGPMIEYPALASFEEGSRAAEFTRIMQYDIVENPLTLSDGFLQLPAAGGLGLGGYVPDAVARLESLMAGGRQ